MEGSLESLAELIFLGDQQGTNSIQLQGEFNNIKDFFEALLMLFTYGMKVKYGNDGKVDLKSLTAEQFIDFRDRFQVLGIIPHYQEYHISQIKSIKGIYVNQEEINDWLVNKKNYPINLPKKYVQDYKLLDSNRLEDFHFSLKCDMNVYILHFTYT